MGGKKQTVTQKSSPWAAAQPFLKNALGQAESLYKAGDFAASPYEGDRVAGFGDATTGGTERHSEHGGWWRAGDGGGPRHDAWDAERRANRTLRR